MLEVLWAAVTRGFPLGAVCGIEKKEKSEKYKVKIFIKSNLIDFTKHLHKY